MRSGAVDVVPDGAGGALCGFGSGGRRVSGEPANTRVVVQWGWAVDYEVGRAGKRPVCGLRGGPGDRAAVSGGRVR